MGYELMNRFLRGSSCCYCLDHLHYCFGGQEEESEKVSNRHGESMMQRIHVGSLRYREWSDCSVLDGITRLDYTMMMMIMMIIYIYMYISARCYAKRFRSSLYNQLLPLGRVTVHGVTFSGNRSYPVISPQWKKV